MNPQGGFLVKSKQNIWLTQAVLKMQGELLLTKICFLGINNIWVKLDGPIELTAESTKSWDRSRQKWKQKQNRKNRARRRGGGEQAGWNPGSTDWWRWITQGWRRKWTPTTRAWAMQPVLLSYRVNSRAWLRDSQLQSQHSGGWGTWGQSEPQCEVHNSLGQQCESLSPKNKNKAKISWDVETAGWGVQGHPW